MAWWLFQNVVITTALAAMVVVVCRATRIGPVARHALWVLVLVKFVTPPLVVWPWPAPDPLGVAALDLRDAHLVAAGPAAAFDEDSGVAAEPVAVFEVSASRPVPGRADHATGGGSAASLFWMFGVWAAGSVFLLALETTRLVRLARQVRTATPADPAIVKRVSDLSARLGLRPVPVLTMDGGAAPVVWCLGRPRLLWPSALSVASTDACIDGVLVHELAHVKRRDHFVGWIELAAGAVWWWNPLFWFVRAALREQAELACDAWVISALPNGRRAYAESLLALSGAAFRGSPSRSMAAVVGISSGSRRVLERRLVMIMKGRAPLRLPMAGLLALALMAAATLPAWATGSQQPPPPPPPQAKPVPAAKPGMPPPPPPAPPVFVESAKPTPSAKPEMPPPPPPPSPPQAARPTPRQVRTGSPTWIHRGELPKLPEDGRQLVERFQTDQKAIVEEIQRKVDERHAVLLKELQNLQETYTKAGKLDEALAIRDFIRAGGPGKDVSVYHFTRFSPRR